MEKELNKKLAEWVGFYLKPIIGEEYLGEFWRAPDRNYTGEKPPSFTSSLDACFKWLVPKLDSEYPEYSKLIAFYYHRLSNQWGCYLDDDSQNYFLAETPALALCRAIEKLIDEEKK